MKARSIVILLFSAVILPIFTPGTGVAITLSSQSYDITYGDNFVTFKIEMSVEGCPITPDSHYWGVAYVPYSCKTLLTTTIITITYRDPRVTSIDISIGLYAGQLGVPIALPPLAATGWVEGYSPLTLTQVLDLETPNPSSTDAIWIYPAASVRFKASWPDPNAPDWPYEVTNSRTEGIEARLQYKDLASSDSALLKGGAKDNPNTDFDGGVCTLPGGYGLPGYMVNTSTLNLVVEDTDFSYSGLGPETAFTRTWNAGPTEPGMFGNNWGFAYESTLVKTCSGATLTKGSGQELTYAAELCPSGNALVYPVSVTIPAGYPAGNYNKLTYMAGDYWVYENKDDRLKYRYNLKPGTTDMYRLTSITDRNGNAQQISYGSDGTISKITDAAGRFTTFGYDLNGHCTSMVVPDGRTATYTYDANGNMVRNTDLLGTAIAYAYDAENYMTSMSYSGKTTTFAYTSSDGWKHVSTVTDANGNQRTYEAYSGKSYVTDALRTWTFYTNEEGRTSEKVVGATGQSTSRAYSNGLPVTFTDANGKTTSMEYDGNGNMTKLTDPLGNITTYAYDASSNLIRKTDVLNKEWTYTYDAKGNLTRSLSPLGKETTFTYNAKGQMLTMKDGNGNTTSFTYDSFGNVLTITNANGKPTTLGYDAFGLSNTSVTDALNRVTQLTYDNNGRLTKTLYPDGSSKTYAYDACTMTSVTDENGNATAFEHDKLLSLTKITDPLSNSSSMTYDANGNMVGLTNALAKTYTMTYDAAGRQTQVKKPSGGTIYKAFDGNNSMLTLTDERSKVTTFAYDADNRVASIADPLGKTTAYTRDAMGRITRKSNPGGASISYTYSEDGKLTNKSYSTGGSITYGYDNAGNLTSMNDATGATAYAYNKLNRAASITYPDSLALAFAYDDVGSISSIAYPGGVVVSYTYDSRNRVSSLSWGTGNSVTYTYDSAGNLLKEQHSNGIESNYTYDKNNRVTSINHKKGTTIFSAMDYKRDAIGNTTEETIANPLSPSLINESITAASNDVNQVGSWGSDVYTYDSNGNLTTISGSQAFGADYDEENRPASITFSGVTTTYTYNGLGLRTKIVSGTQIRNFHHDASGRLMFETDGNNAVTAWYVYGGGALSAMTTPSGGKYFYHFDKTGNTIALTDGDGNIVSAYAYEPFGKVSNKTGTVANSFTYVGALGVMDEDNGLYSMRNRYYDSNTGKFLQKDPIGFAGGVNLYRYVGNNPVEGIDPEGKVDLSETFIHEGLVDFIEMELEGGALAQFELMKSYSGSDSGFREKIRQMKRSLDAQPKYCKAPVTPQEEERLERLRKQRERARAGAKLKDLIHDADAEREIADDPYLGYGKLFQVTNDVLRAMTDKEKPREAFGGSR